MPSASLIRSQAVLPGSGRDPAPGTIVLQPASWVKAQCRAWLMLPENAAAPGCGSKHVVVGGVAPQGATGPAVHERADGLGDRRQRQHVLRRPAPDRLLAAFRTRREVASSWAIVAAPASPHLEQALGAVVAHPGQEHADRVRARRLARPSGTARPRSADGARRAGRPSPRRSSARRSSREPQCACRPGRSARGPRSTRSPSCASLTSMRQSWSSRSANARGEALGHVLHDHACAGASGGSAARTVAQGLRAAGRGADRDDRSVARAADAARRLRAARAAVAATGQARRPARARACGRRRARCRRSRPPTPPGNRARPARLGDHVDRPGLEGVERRRGPACERRADHDRDRALGHDLAQEGQAVHPRHLEVEHDHVRAVVGYLAHGDEGVGGPSTWQPRGLRAQDRRQRLADDRRVVHHEHLDVAAVVAHHHAPSLGDGHRRQRSGVAQAVRVGRPGQALRVAEQEAARPAPSRSSETIDHAARASRVEVDEDVAAEDQVERPRPGYASAFRLRRSKRTRPRIAGPPLIQPVRGAHAPEHVRLR